MSRAVRSITVGVSLFVLLFMSGCALGSAKLGADLIGSIEVSGHFDPTAGIGQGTLTDKETGTDILGASIEFNAPLIMKLISDKVISVVWRW